MTRHTKINDARNDLVKLNVILRFCMSLWER